MLVPLQLGLVARDPWLTLPPKPIGDGPDYENIGFHIAQGDGWSMDWTDPDWRAPYLEAERNRAPLPATPDAASGTADGGTAAPASYSVQLARDEPLAATTARPPLLPALIALVYWIVERGPFAFAAIRLALAACLAVAGAIAVAMSVRLAGVLTPRVWPVAIAGAVTLLLACLDRTLRSYATDFLTEPLALLLVECWLWCVLEMLPIYRSDRTAVFTAGALRQLRALATLAGVCLGLLITARSAAVLWLPGVWALLAWVWQLRSRPTPELAETSAVAAGTQRAKVGGQLRRQGLAVATRMAVVALLVCLPWWVRNCLVLEAWMPLGTQGATTLVGGYSDEALAHGGQWQYAPELRLRQRVSGEQVSDHGGPLVHPDVRLARAASDQVRAWVHAHWRDLPMLAWYRLSSEWAPYSGRSLLWKLAALLGLIYLAVRLPPAAAFIGGVLLINTLMVMGLYSLGGRFLVPTYGMLYSLAGIGVAAAGIAAAQAVARVGRSRA